MKRAGFLDSVVEQAAIAGASSSVLGLSIAESTDIAALVQALDAAEAADKRIVEAAIDEFERTGGAADIELDDEQSILLMRFAIIGRKVSKKGGETLQADRARDVRNWVQATRPAAKNVRELRALPDFPKGSQKLMDSTVRAAARSGGMVLQPGRPKKS